MPDRSAMSVSMLGPLEVMGRGPRVKLGGPQQRRVLAVLAVDANKVVSSDRLIEVLWGEVPPASASHTLQTLVSRLRGGLGRDRVETVAPGYRLRVEAAEVDGLRFEELVRTGLGLADRPEAAAARFEEALALWRGRPYEEFAEEEFATSRGGKARRPPLVRGRGTRRRRSRAWSTGRSDRSCWRRTFRRSRSASGCVPC